MLVQFLGAAQNVTGSCYFIQTEKYKFLIDCGQFQGNKSEIKKNLDPFPFDPRELDFIVLTHAHIDHTGRLPILTRDGFVGRIYLTRGTASLSEILLPDSGKIHEVECENENVKRKKAGLDSIEPLYTVEDAKYSLSFFNPIIMGEEIIVNDDISLYFANAGHLLGSTHVYVKLNGKILLFSGDIGTEHSQILNPPEIPTEADYIFMETTYGDRVHSKMNERFQNLYAIIKETISQKGTVIIPAFAVGRTQDLIYGLKTLIAKHSKNDTLLKVPFYVDSPMAINATKVYNRDLEGVKENIVKDINEKIHPYEFKNLKFITEAKDSIMLNKSEESKILISASGMCDAGRILHHLKAYLDNEKTAIIFVGYQSEESLGRKIKNEDSSITIYGKEITNKAKIYTVSGFSGHADQGELLNWIGKLKKPPKRIYLMHGDLKVTQTFQILVENKYNYETYIPKLYEIVEI